jgi:hypothetical protein
VGVFLEVHAVAQQLAQDLHLTADVDLQRVLADEVHRDARGQDERREAEHAVGDRVVLAVQRLRARDRRAAVRAPLPLVVAEVPAALVVELAEDAVATDLGERDLVGTPAAGRGDLVQRRVVGEVLDHGSLLDTNVLGDEGQRLRAGLDTGQIERPGRDEDLHAVVAGKLLLGLERDHRLLSGGVHLHARLARQLHGLGAAAADEHARTRRCLLGLLHEEADGLVLLGCTDERRRIEDLVEAQHDDRVRRRRGGVRGRDQLGLRTGLVEIDDATGHLQAAGDRAAQPITAGGPHHVDFAAGWQVQAVGGPRVKAEEGLRTGDQHVGHELHHRTVDDQPTPRLCAGRRADGDATAVDAVGVYVLVELQEDRLVLRDGVDGATGKRATQVAGGQAEGISTAAGTVRARRIATAAATRTSCKHDS